MGEGTGSKVVPCTAGVGPLCVTPLNVSKEEELKVEAGCGKSES